ncbi:hypothetical protein [Xanthomonas euvesicatoria]|uniref:hypothetical protein n=1 Tax=Xanthomonas euvesicatoria TaxID=456327 RepID=UPI001E503173|nr:hypothetical protein [Xanthomonas euvesicatoria]
MSLLANNTALPSADIWVPWLVIEPSLASSVRLPPAASWLTRASLVLSFCAALERWLLAWITTGVIAAMVPAAAPSASRLILLMVEPVSTMFLVVESRAPR